MQTFLASSTAPVAGKIFDSYGPRPLLVLGTILHIGSILLLSISTQYYQIFLTQGLLGGFGTAFIFWSAALSVSTHFKARRGLANGIIAMGGSVGGVIST